MNYKKKSFFENYRETLIDTYNSLDLEKLEKIYKIIFEAISNNKQIFVCGNGGSASIANHFLCDFNKGVKISSNNKVKPKIFSLSNSIELMTAISNDIDYSKIFTYQLENYYKKGDILIAFSCSGTSGNIINISNYAKKKNIRFIKFFGFENNFLPKKNEIILTLNSNNYGISEDIFQGIMHMISQKIRSKYIKKKINFREIRF